MTGGSLVGLILLSMAWLFFAGGSVTNFSVLPPFLDVYCPGWIFTFIRSRNDRAS